jgi:PAS domain-containing protein
MHEGERANSERVPAAGLNADADANRITRVERMQASMQNVVWEADLTLGHLVYVSPQAEKLLGYARAQWLTPDFWATHIHPDDRSAALEYCARRARTHSALF